MPSNLEMKVISPTGGKVGLLCPDRRQFWVFKVDPIELICTGEFQERLGFQRGHENESLSPQIPPPRYSRFRSNFHACAISDDFLALGCQGIIMAFFLGGEEAGCWVATMKLHDDAIPEHLTFSPDGKYLAVLVREPSGHIIPPRPAAIRARSGSAVLVFETDPFPKEHLTRLENLEPFMPAMDVTIQLDSFCPHQPARISLSQHARKIAVSTTVNDNIAVLQLFSRTKQWWQPGERRGVSVFPHDDPTTWHGRGITGMEL
jgi:hypothetical protein